jgi:hypothetical protein
MNSASPLSSSLSLSLSLFFYLDLTILVAKSKILASDLACILDSDLDFNYVVAWTLAMLDALVSALTDDYAYVCDCTKDFKLVDVFAFSLDCCLTALTPVMASSLN